MPYNILSGGKLTNAQQEILDQEGAAQIMAVANSPGAQVSPAVRTAATQAALQQSGQVPADTAAVLSLPAPSNSSIDLSLLGTALGAQSGSSFLGNYGPLLLIGLGVFALYTVAK